MKVYDVGVNVKGIASEERYPIAWPVAVWRCHIPENVEKSINALEKLILSLINIGVNDPIDILCNQVGLDRTLVNTAIEECKINGYIRKNGVELTLNKPGKDMLVDMDNPYESDMALSEEMKVIYMFQDLVTKSVVPYFNIEKKPVFWEELDDDSVIKVKYSEYDYSKPKTVALKNALKYWCRIYKRFNESEPPQFVFSSKIEDRATMNGFDPCEDEEDWRDVENAPEIVTLADKEAEEKRESEKVKVISIYDDNPEIMYIKAYVAIDVDNVTEPLVLAPFGKNLDSWFRTVVNRLRVIDEGFELALEMFLEEKKETLADKIAFNNSLHIELFDRFPTINNRDKYSGLKVAIEDLYKAKNRFFEGDMATATRDLNSKFSTAMQSLLKEVLKAHPEMLWDEMATKFPEMKPLRKMNNKDLSDFEFQLYQDIIKTLRKTIPVLDRDEIRSYEVSRVLFRNAKVREVDRAYSTGVIALILFSAGIDCNSLSRKMLHSYPEFVENTNYVKGERNDMEHANEGFEKITYTPEEVKRKFVAFEEIVSVIYGHYLEG